MKHPLWLAQQTDAALVRDLLPVRPRNSHKGDYGSVLLLCGSVGLTGAAVLAAQAASRTGSGLVFLGVPQAVYPICAAHCRSQIVFPLPCDEEGRLSLSALDEIDRRLVKMDAVLLGPGLGRGGVAGGRAEGRRAGRSRQRLDRVARRRRRLRAG